MGVGYEVGRDPALVDLHPLDISRFETFAPPVVVHGDEPVAPNAAHNLADDSAKLDIVARYRGDVADFLGTLNGLSQVAQALDRGFLSSPEALAQQHRVRAGGNVVETPMHNGLRQHRGRGRAVLRHGVGLGRGFLHDLDAQIEKHVVYPIDLIGDGHPVVCDLWRAQCPREGHIPATRPERGPYGVGNDIDAGTQRLTGLVTEADFLLLGRGKLVPNRARNIGQGGSLADDGENVALADDEVVLIV